MAFLLRLFLMFLVTTTISTGAYLRRARDARDEMRKREIEKQTEIGARTKSPEYGIDVVNRKKPEVEHVLLKDEGPNGDVGAASVRDVFEIEYMASGVVGLVGVPVRVDYDENAKPTLTFYYNKDALRGIPERNLIILHESVNGTYDQVGQETLDQAAHTLSVAIPEPGIYMMADRYQWYSAWGIDVSEYAYDVDPTAYVSDWERSCDTGSIMELADKKWAMENAPVFHVSTPEQLASVVYYNNAIANYATEPVSLEIYLEDDIDLDGYKWVPMGWMGAQDNRFNGVVDGRGHAILNMSIDVPNQSHCAFIGYSTGVVVRDLEFKNAYVKGGSYTGIVGGEIYISREWENVVVEGVIEDAYGEVGSIIGREGYLHFKDCAANVILRRSGREDQEMEYFSHRQEVLANTPVVEKFLLTKEKDGSITRSTLDEDIWNLTWHLDVEGVEILGRGAENETNFDPSGFFKEYLDEGKECKIWLEAYSGEVYVRVSNVIEYR